MKFKDYVTRKESSSDLPMFMQKAANRQSLDHVMQKSLRQTNYSNGQFIPQISSFEVMS